MIEKLKYQIAQNSDIPSVLKLQELYLVSNLTDKEKESGFVTTPFTADLLTEVIANEGLFVAKDNDRVVAYIFAESWAFFSRYPIFEYMISLMPNLELEGLRFDVHNSFQYGPVCIHKDYRGKGLINILFELMRCHVIEKYPLSLTFINKINAPSMKAHVQKLHWTVVGDFQFNNNDYFILAYDMSVKLI